MNFKSKVFSYLSGSSFSNGLKVEFDKMPFVSLDKSTRLELITQICKNKQVIHVGCVDHVPLIQEKIKTGRWLHKIITETASECIGLDISEKGIEYCKNELSYDNVFCMDIENDDLIKPLLDKHWDVMILGEILEHVDNPVLFLSRVKEKFSKICSNLVITVPNAFRYINFFNAAKRIEIINTDHRYWFTPYTLTKCLFRAGYTIDSFAMCQHGGYYPWYKVLHRVWLCFPLFRDDIVMIANF